MFNDQSELNLQSGIFYLPFAQLLDDLALCWNFTNDFGRKLEMMLYKVLIEDHHTANKEGQTHRFTKQLTSSYPVKCGSKKLHQL